MVWFQYPRTRQSGLSIDTCSDPSISSMVQAIHYPRKELGGPCIIQRSYKSMWWNREQDIRNRLNPNSFSRQDRQGREELNIRACHTNCHCPCSTWQKPHIVQPLSQSSIRLKKRGDEYSAWLTKTEHIACHIFSERTPCDQLVMLDNI